MTNYHKSNVAILMISFIVTFKFHHLALSYMANSSKLSGDFDSVTWRTWNAIAFTYIIVSYAPMVASCVLYLIDTIDNFGEIPQYVALEVLILSTFVAILLIVGMMRICPCCNRCLKQKKA